MKKIFGNTNGLKSTQIKTLENLYQFRTPPEMVATSQMIEQICALSCETNRQIGLLIHRTGKITSVIIGDHKAIMIPDTSEYKTPPGRLKGLRCLHTHMKNEPLSHDDLTDLTLLRLDLMAAVTMTRDGKPDQLYLAHVLPNPSEKHYYQALPPMPADGAGLDCAGLIKSIESELLKINALYDVDTGVDRAILISVDHFPTIQS
jgi:GTP-binding protein HflX